MRRSSRPARDTRAETDLWKRLYQEGRVPLPRLPASVTSLIQAVENPACRAALDLLMRSLVASGAPRAHAALERWCEASDPALADMAFRHIGGVPLPPWADRILTRIAATEGHPRRYEAMLLLNSASRHRPLFESALKDSDPKIRSAAYSSFSIHGRLEHLSRLAEGLRDRAKEVRAHVIDLVLEHLVGSEIDSLKPLFQRKWEESQHRKVRVLLRNLRLRFQQLRRSERGEARQRAALAFTLLPQQKNPSKKATRAAPGKRPRSY